MTDKRNEIKERIEREFEICDRHIARIKRALEDLSTHLPLQLNDYASQDTELVRCIDQFIFRFSKLQDAMGAKLFRYILEYLDEDIKYLPMRDILNRLERYGIIPSSHDWIYIRELRNDIAHDYSIDEKDTVIALNELISKTETLLAIYDSLKERFYNISSLSD